MTAPPDIEIRTERLLLRPLRAADAPAIERLAGDERVSRYTARIPHPYPDGSAERFIAEVRNREARDEGRWFAIARRADPDALFGMIGLEDRRDGTMEIGYWLGVPAWGQGLMSEAVRPVADFARKWRPQSAIVTHTFPENIASQRVLEKAGFRRTGTITCDAPARERKTVANAPSFVFEPEPQSETAR